MKFFAIGSLVACATIILPAISLADHSVNINTADPEALMTLTGIGEVKAQAIVEYRSTHGAFGSKEEIQEVSGIGPSTYESIKDHITVTGGSTSSPSPSPSSSSSSVSGSPSPSLSTVSSQSLSLDAGGDRSTTARADIKLTAQAYLDKKKVVDRDTNFYWNFGDGTTGRGAVITHQFEHAGKYAVIVEVRFGGQSAFDRFTITADDAKLFVFVGGDGGVGIENKGDRDVDLSYWTVRSEGKSFTFSEHSIVLAGQSIRLSPSTLGFTATADTELAFPGGELAFKAGKEPQDSVETLEIFMPAVPAPDSRGSVSINTAVEDVFDAEVRVEDSENEQESNGTSSQVAAAASTMSSWPWWAAVAAIAFGAGGALYVARRFSKQEWDIIEDTES